MFCPGVSFQDKGGEILLVVGVTFLLSSKQLCDAGAQGHCNWLPASLLAEVIFQSTV